MSSVFDDELQRALDASAAMARANDQQPLVLEKTGNNSQTPIPRASRAPPHVHHFRRYNGKTKEGGYFVSAPGVQQFHSAFQPLISKYGTAGAICGYTTCAEVCILLRAVQEMKELQKSTPERRWSREEEIEYLLAQTRDVPKVMAEVERAMRFVHASRADWIDTHQDQFPTEIKKRNHLRNWVANYELSDAIFKLAINRQAREPKGSAPAPVDFVRFNQFHEISAATPDEYVRIKAEEERFGGRAHPQHKGQPLYGEGESMFLVERFEASEMIRKPGKFKPGTLPPLRAGPIVRKLQSPEEWTAEVSNSASSLRVFAVDLNGHFSAGFSIDGICVFINTTNNDYVRAEIMNWYFDLRFPPADASTESLGETKANNDDPSKTSSSSSPPLGRRSSSDRGGGLRVPSNSVVSDHDLATMMSMGFPEQASRRSLETAGGNLMHAMNILLAEGSV